MRKKIFAIVLAVAGVLLLGTFSAYGDAGHPLVLLAAATVPFAAQTKILGIAAVVYAVLQGIKKIVPVTGFTSVALNICLSVGGMLIAVQPQDLWSMQTLTTVLLAGLGAAGVHGTVRSFISDGPGPNLITMKSLAFGCLGLMVLGSAGCKETPDQIARDVLATSSGTLDQAQTEYLAECQSNPGKQVCSLINKAGDAQNAAITALETYCGYQLTPTPPDPATQCVPVASAYGGLVTATTNLNQIIGELKPLVHPSAKPTLTRTLGGAF
jgi:hypothetical protein